MACGRGRQASLRRLMCRSGTRRGPARPDIPRGSRFEAASHSSIADQTQATIEAMLRRHQEDTLERERSSLADSAPFTEHSQNHRRRRRSPKLVDLLWGALLDPVGSLDEPRPAGSSPMVPRMRLAMKESSQRSRAPPVEARPWPGAGLAEPPAHGGIILVFSIWRSA